MQTIHLTSQTISHWENQFQQQVLAIGFFDGLHKGHLSVIQEAKHLAKINGTQVAVMSFFPHPKTVVAAQSTSFQYLMPLEDKQAVLAELGIDTLFLVHFDKDIASLSSVDFVQKFLIGLNVMHVVCGVDFHYGARGSGCVKSLEKQGVGHFQVSALELMEYDGEKISSTRIRQALEKGNIPILQKLLGKFYSVNWCPRNGLLPFYSLPAPGEYEVKLHYKDKIVSCNAEVLNEKEAKFTYDFKRWRHAIKIEWVKTIANV